MVFRGVPDRSFPQRFSSYGADVSGVTVDQRRESRWFGKSSEATIHGTET